MSSFFPFDKHLNYRRKFTLLDIFSIVINDFYFISRQRGTFALDTVTKIGLFITCSILRFFRWETFYMRNIFFWVTQLNRESLAELEKSIVDVCDLDRGDKERKKLL